MEQYPLTKKEYADLQKIISDKRAIKEMLESLKAQLSSSIVQEDRWWRKVVTKHDLDTENNVYSISHATQEVVGMERPKPQTSEKPQQKQVQPNRGITLRDRTPEMDHVLSKEEIIAMNKAKEAIKNGNN